MKVTGFRPLIRGFFFYRIESEDIMKISSVVSVPSFGDSFFIMKVRMYRNYDKFVSVPSFGDSFFIRYYAKHCLYGISTFPSPHSGILFLWKVENGIGSFGSCVSVPSFGDSFFIKGGEE